MTEPILKPVKKIRGGVKPPHLKNTAEIESVIMPAPKKVVISMLQHIGVECEPLVKKGDEVFVGTKIGDSEKLVSAPIHSSVSGKVIEIGSLTLPSGQRCKTVVIESDGKNTPDPSLAPVEVNTPEDLIKATRDCGLVGLGGAGFPTSVKLTQKEGTVIDTLIINGAECEPYITVDYRECMENSDDILEGIYKIKEILNIKKVIITIESNKPKAIERLREIAADKKDVDNSVSVMKLKSAYPQGAEKVIIYSATGRKLPAGKLPSDVGCIVMNITSVATLNKFIKTGMPLVTKRITVDGDIVNNPQNVIVPIGTSINDVLEFCGGLKSSPEKVLFGGPMMGITVADLNTPILKQNNAITVIGAEGVRKTAETPCIRCGRCASVCPMGLFPLEVGAAVKTENAENLLPLNVGYCMECGSCSYICPANRPLTQMMRIAKKTVRNIER